MLISNRSTSDRKFTNALLTPNFLVLAEVLALHDYQIEYFGGSAGIRDLGLLESALAQPKASFGGAFYTQHWQRKQLHTCITSRRITRSLTATNAPPTP